MAAQNAVAKQSHALISLYEKCFEAKYGRKPQINRFRDKWGFQDMVSDLGYGGASEVVEYYFKTAKHGHPLTFLFQNYDKIHEFMQEKMRDEEKRAELRKQTALRVKEREEKHGER